MASYHCTVKAGASAGAGSHADYIEREGKYQKKKDSDLEAVESGNLPEWAKSSSDFWHASDEHERANAKGYREFEVALPREFTPAQRLALVQDFVRQEIGDRHAYTFAIHNPKAALEGGEQPHAHIMFSERVNDGLARSTPQHYFKKYSSKDPARGGCKKVNGVRQTQEERKADLVALRGRWAGLQNKHLEMNGQAARVDHRSLKDQEIDREPEQHLGPKQSQANAPAAQLVLQARADRTLSALLANAVAGAQRRLDRLESLARAVVAKFTKAPAPAREKVPQAALPAPLDVTPQELRSPPVAAPIVRQAAPDPLVEMAEYIRAMRAEIKRVKASGVELEARESKAVKIHQAKQAEALRIKATLVEPDGFSFRSTREKFGRDLAETRELYVTAAEAEKQAHAQLAEAKKMQTDDGAQAIARAHLRRERPELVQRAGELHKADPGLHERAGQYLADLARSTPRAIEPAPVRRPDIDKIPGR